MRIVTANIQSAIGDPLLKVQHNNQELDFTASYYGRNSFNSGVDLFEQLNNYWITLPAQELDRMFELYGKMHAIMNSPFSTHSTLVSELAPICSELMDLQKFDNFQQWLYYKSGINIPSSFEEKFVYNVDKQNSEGQTYLRGEYVALVTLSLVFRTLMPIWGEFISMMRKEHGNFLKEFHAYQIIKNAHIQTHHSLIKLSHYVERTIGDDKENLNAIINEGLSSEDFHEWVLARTIVRRLCISDVRGISPEANVVTFVHKYVAESARPTQTSIESRIEDKNRDNARSEEDGEDKLSSMERYRIKHNISIGEIEEMNFALSDLWVVCNKLTSHMTKEIYEVSMDSAKAFHGNKITKMHLMLAQWTLKPIVSPCGLGYMEYDSLVKYLGAVSAVLWARGHHHFSIMATAHTKTDKSIMQVSAVDSVKRLPVELAEELKRCYPHHRMSGGKKTGYIPVPTVIESLEQMYSNMSLSVWTPTVPDDRLITAYGTPITRLSTPINIRTMLANFILEIGRRDWH